MTGGALELHQLEVAAHALGIELPLDCPSRLLRYLDILYQWNASAGLTTIRREDAVRLHVVDSLTVLLSVRSAARLVDLGTGAGLPGIPVALARPDLSLALVESKRRKCNFLRVAVRELGLTNCEVVEADAGSLVCATPRWDTAVARAFRQPQNMLDLAAQIAGRDIVMMAGPTLDAEKLALPQRWRRAEDRSLQLPGGTEWRRLLRFELSERA